MIKNKGKLIDDEYSIYQKMIRIHIDDIVDWCQRPELHTKVFAL